MSHPAAETHASPPGRIVLYDADCGFCRWSLDKLLAWDRRQALRPVAIQSDRGQALLEAGGVPEARRLDSWHLVLPDGRLFSGGAAAPLALEVLPGGRLLAAAARALPGLTERLYRLIAANRTRLGRLVGADASCEVRR